MELSRPEYWSGQPFPPPGDLPNPGIEPRSPTLQAFSLPAEPKRKPKNTGVRSLSLLQGIYMTQESNQGFLHCRQILYQLSYQGSSRLCEETKITTGYVRLPRICLFWLNVKISQLHTSKVNIHTLHGQMLTLMCLLCSHLLSRVWFFETPWTVTQQAPLSMGFSRQEYWSGLPFPTPGELLRKFLLQSRDQTCISCVSYIGRQILYHCITWDVHKHIQRQRKISISEDVTTITCETTVTFQPLRVLWNRGIRGWIREGFWTAVHWMFLIACGTFDNCGQSEPQYQCV